jgi:hypothetical protein
MGSRLELRVNGASEPVISVDDETWSKGKVGVRMYTTDNDHAFAVFDNVRATPIRSGK